MRIVSLFVCLCTLWPATAQKISRDDAMLAKVYLKYRSLAGLSQRVKGTMKVNAGGAALTATFNTRTTMARPNRFRSESEIDFFGTTTRGIAITDGKTLWDYDPHVGQYAEQPLAPLRKRKDADWLMDRAGIDFPLMLFTDVADALLKTKPGADSSIEIKNFPSKVIDGTPMHVVAVNLPGERGKKPGTATLYIGAKDMLIRRCRLSMKDKGRRPGELLSVDVVCFYTDIKPDFEAPSETFTFSPPENSQKLPKLAPAFSRAFEGQ